MDEFSELYFHIIQAADIGIIILSDEMRVVCWNRWIAEASGISSEKSLGQEFFKLFPQCRGGRFQMALEDALKNSTASLLSSAWNHYTLPLHQPQNADILMTQSLIIKPIKQDNKRYCAIEVFDVTNSTKREGLLKEKTAESLKAQESAEIASRIKSEFVSTVSHELRTPVTAISGSLDLVLGGVVGQLPQKVRDLVEIAAKNAKRLLTLVNDLLDMQKIEMGKMEFIFSQVDLNQLLIQVIENNQAFAEQYQVWFDYNDQKKAFYVNADAHRLSQAIINLLSNAAKFSYPQQPIKVVLQAQGEDKIRLAITNIGDGIPEEYRDTIFDRFMQVKDRGDGDRGTGLGLNISKAIIEHHGGEIGFTSTPGQETTFYFILPRSQAKLNA